MRVFDFTDSEAALVGLDHASMRKPMLLEPLLERLFPFLLDDSSFNRSLAYMLLARCLKYNPKMSSRVLQAVFDCLHSERPSVVESACNALPELIICYQGGESLRNYSSVPLCRVS